jgi:hypothetical protein
MKTSDQITCEAFTRAVPSIGQPSTDLKTSVDILLRQIHSPQFSEISAPLAAEIRALVEEYPELDRVYQVERQKLQREYRGSDRAKGMAMSPQAPVSIDHSFFTHTNGNTNSTQPNPNFWEGGDRVLVIAAGGAILGGMLAQIPGATIGAVLAGIYGWYTKDTNTDQLTAAKLDILRALDKRPYTTQDLISYMDITTPPDQVRAMVQSLWIQGYIDTLSGGILREFLPVSKGRSPHPPDPDASLTLTSKGHFSVHPIFRFGSQKAMFR